MLLSDTTNIGLVEDVKFLTGTPDDFSAALIKRYINEGYKYAAMVVLSAMDQWDFQGQISTANLVANQREYVFPSNLLRITRIEAKFDGTNWVKLQKLQENTARMPLSSETDITNSFSSVSGGAFFKDFDRSFWIYSGTISSVTSGLKVWYQEDITELSSDADVPVLEPAFHRALSLYAAKVWAAKHEDTRLLNSIREELGERQMNGMYTGMLGKMQEYYAKRESEAAPRMKARREKFE